MDTPDADDRLTLLERAQLLHDATLRRHGEMLEAHAERLDRLDLLLEQQQHLQVALRGIAERLSMQHQDLQHRLTTQHEAQSAQLASHDALLRHLQHTLDAIKDLLDRGNGR
jgi:hypothetical protein